MILSVESSSCYKRISAPRGQKEAAMSLDTPPKTGKLQQSIEATSTGIGQGTVNQRVPERKKGWKLRP